MIDNMNSRDLQKQREEARKAMSPQRKPSTQDNSDGGVSRDQEDSGNSELEKMREEARKAMEGRQRQETRRKEEEEKRQEEERRRKIEEVKKERERLEVKQKREEEERQKQEAEEEKEKKESYQRNLKEAEETIKNIKEKATPITPLNTLDRTVNNLKETNERSYNTQILNNQSQTISTPVKKSSKKLPIITILFSLILLGGGFWILYSTTDFVFEREQGVEVEEIDSIIPADINHKIIIDQKTPLDIFNLIKANLRPYQNPTIANFEFTRTTINEDEETIETKLNFKDLISVLNLNLEADFSHFIENEFMMGGFSTNNSSMEVFYILNTRSFEHTYDILLREENNIIKTLYEPLVSTEEIRVLNNNEFIDETIDNTDTRIIKNTSEEIEFAYTFITPELLLITQSRQALLFIKNSL